MTNNSFDYFLQLKVNNFAHSRISKDCNSNSRTFQGLEFSIGKSRPFQEFQGFSRTVATLTASMNWESTRYTVEPCFNDLRYNDIPGLTMELSLTERKIFPVITIKSTLQTTGSANIVKWNCKLLITLTAITNCFWHVIEEYSGYCSCNSLDDQALPGIRL